MGGKHRFWLTIVPPQAHQALGSFLRPCYVLRNGRVPIVIRLVHWSSCLLLLTLAIQMSYVVEIS